MSWGVLCRTKACELSFMSIEVTYPRNPVSAGPGHGSVLNRHFVPQMVEEFWFLCLFILTFRWWLWQEPLWPGKFPAWSLDWSHTIWNNLWWPHFPSSPCFVRGRKLYFPPALSYLIGRESSQWELIHVYHQCSLPIPPPSHYPLLLHLIKYTLHLQNKNLFNL